MAQNAESAAVIQVNMTMTTSLARVDPRTRLTTRYTTAASTAKPAMSGTMRESRARNPIGQLAACGQPGGS